VSRAELKPRTIEARCRAIDTRWLRVMRRKRGPVPAVSPASVVADLIAAAPGAYLTRATGRSRRPVRHTLAGMLFLSILLWLSPAALASPAGDALGELKAAYIYRFTSFIEWPEAPRGAPFVIGVIDDPAMEERLRELERSGRQVGGRPIAVRRYDDARRCASCEILFIGSDAGGRLASIVQQTIGRPMLLIGDTPGFAGRGVAIELFTKPDIFPQTERLRFRIDPKALRSRGLSVSAPLYDVAEVIE
jgi:hypothetical protein